MKNINNTQYGFTLIELILYVAISAIILLSVSTLISFLIGSNIKNGVILNVEQQGAQITQIITQTIENSKTITGPVDGAQADALYATSENNESIAFSLGSSMMVLRSDENGGGDYLLNNSNVIIKDLNFESTATNSIKFNFTVEYKNNTNKNEYNYSKTFYGGASIKSQISILGDWKNLSLGTTTSTVYAPDKLYINGNYAYTLGKSSPYGNLAIINLTTLETTKIALPDNPTNIFVYKNYAYITLYRQQLLIINLSNPTDLSNIFILDGDPTLIHGLFIKDDIVYITSITGAFVMLDISTPSTPHILHKINKIIGHSVYISRSYAYVATKSTYGIDLVTFNVGDPENEELWGRYDIEGHDNDASSEIVVSGNTAILTQGTTMHTIDISNPRSPVLYNGASKIELPGTPIVSRYFANSGKYCFVSTKNSGEFLVIGIQNPAEPNIIANIGTPIETTGGIYYSGARDKAFLVGLDSSHKGIFVTIEPSQTK